ncbi:MAG: hypothetical protein IJX99_05525 [Clostridia bacterium]|nr:hypothetical protein [Clostridia bacterium]
MFELIEIRSYDTHHRYGTDWHTDYCIKTDENLNIHQVIERLQELGKNPCGECKLITVEGREEIVLKTIMY